MSASTLIPEQIAMAKSGQEPLPRWMRLYNVLTAPHPDIKAVHVGRQARITSTILVVLFIISLFTFSSLERLPIAPLYVIGCYLLSRRKHYWLGAVGMLFFFGFVPFATYFEIVRNAHLLDLSAVWLLMPVILTSLLIGLQATVITAIAVSTTALVVRFALGELFAYEFLTNGDLLLILVASIVISVATFIRDRYIVAGQLQELRDAQRELQRRNQDLILYNRELRDFASILAHDLRAPLVNIRGFTDELQALVREAFQNAQPEDSLVQQEDVDEFFGFLEESAVAMDELLDQLLGLSRAGRRELTLELVRLDALVEHSLVMQRHSLQSRQIEVEHQPLPSVYADHDGLQQVMDNLVGNAVKYLDPGRPGTIRIWADEDDEKVVIYIQDNGRGIAEDDLEKIFQPFRRARNSGETDGRGLGLAFVRTLIRRHGGQVAVQSQLGQGTTFSFSLPKRTPEATEAA